MQELIGKYHEGITNNDYHANKDHYSSSQLKKAMESHATFRWYMENGENTQSEWSPSKLDARDFGSLVHARLLEPHTIMDDFIFADTMGRNWRTKDDRQYKAEMISKAKASGKILLASHAMDKAKLMEESVRNHAFASKLLFEMKGRPEVSGYYHDDFHGLNLRFRPDRLLDDAIVDVKTIENLEQFEKTAKWTFHYDLSAAMYVEGHMKLTGELVPFYFVVVEREAPYRTAVYKCSEKFLKRGKDKLERAKANVKLAIGGEFRPEVFQVADWEEI